MPDMCIGHFTGVCLHCYYPRPLDENSLRQSRTALTSEVRAMIPSKASLATKSATIRLEMAMKGSEDSKDAGGNLQERMEEEVKVERR